MTRSLVLPAAVAAAAAAALALALALVACQPEANIDDVDAPAGDGAGEGEGEPVPDGGDDDDDVPPVPGDDDDDDLPPDPPPPPPPPPPPAECAPGAVTVCSETGDGNFECTMTHDGMERGWLMHVPAGVVDDAAAAGAGVPVVFAFHGLSTSAEFQRWISKMDADADAAGYVVVYPIGTGPSLQLSWNADSCCASAAQANVDDVGFTRAILDLLRAPLCVDAQRVYATGLSNGGHMSYRLACEASDIIAAIAPVAGAMTTSPCEPARPVPVLHFHGRDDAIVRYAIGTNGLNGAERSVEGWAERNGCDAEPSTTLTQGEVTCIAYPGCDAGAAAELCTVENGGHTWPGGEEFLALGHTTQDVSATEMMRAFFLAHPMP